MDLSEALAITSHLKGRYQAFEKLEEVLQAANSAEGQKKYFEKEVKDLKEEVDQLQKEKTASQTSVTNLNKQQREILAKVNELQNQFNAAAEEIRKDKEAKLAEAEKELAAQSEALRKQFDEQRAELGKVIVALHEEIQDLTEKRDKLKALLDDTKAKVGG